MRLGASWLNRAFEHKEIAKIMAWPPDETAISARVHFEDASVVAARDERSRSPLSKQGFVCERKAAEQPGRRFMPSLVY